MTKDRILMTTYPTAFFHRGGGEAELIDLQSNLRKFGLMVEIYGPSILPLINYDIILHYSVVSSSIGIVREAKNMRKKIVLLPSLWWNYIPTQSEKDVVSEFFELSDSIVFKSKAEYDNIAQHVVIDNAKVVYCRWGVDPCFDEPVDKELFKSSYNLKEYILWAGIIEEIKNQLTAIRALKNSELPVVFIGDYRDRSYYEACVRSAPRHFKFLPNIQPKSEMLRSAIQNCKVFLEVPLEPPGLSALEASLALKPMVLPSGPWTDEHFGDLVQKVDPKSTSSIQKGVLAALEMSVSPELPKRTRSLHLLPQTLEPLLRVLQLG